MCMVYQIVEVYEGERQCGWSMTSTGEGVIDGGRIG
jgi:hypothetical protein